MPEDGADVAAGEGDLEEDIRVMTPLARRGRVEEFVYPAIFLASDASSYVTGHNLVVESGCGAVALGRACLFPPLSSDGALVARP